MRGHHPESCPRRVLQQGELWVDTSRASGQRVTARVRGFRRLNFRLAPLVLIFEMLKKAIGILLKSSLYMRDHQPQFSLAQSHWHLMG